MKLYISIFIVLILSLAISGQTKRKAKAANPKAAKVVKPKPSEVTTLSVSVIEIKKATAGRGQGTGSGNGQGYGSGSGSGAKASPGNKDTQSATGQSPVKILSKPSAIYTDSARDNQVYGIVRLRVTFLASGEIGTVAVVSGLPNGLNETAVDAAKAIKFEPAKRSGIPVTTSKIVEYNFVLY